MKLTFALAAATLFAAPVFAQEEVTCGDYSIMDNAKQMETIAAIESLTSEMANVRPADGRRHPREAGGGLQGKVDVLVIDVVKATRP